MAAADPAYVLAEAEARLEWVEWNAVRRKGEWHEVRRGLRAAIDAANVETVRAFLAWLDGYARQVRAAPRDEK